MGLIDFWLGCESAVTQDAPYFALGSNNASTGKTDHLIDVVFWFSACTLDFSFAQPPSTVSAASLPDETPGYARDAVVLSCPLRGLVPTSVALTALRDALDLC